jgi:hypothetical protein
MTLAELETKLANSGVPKEAYCPTGGLPNEAYCIEESDGKWHVYYSERGSRRGLKSFDAEQEACEELFRWIAHDLLGR